MSHVLTSRLISSASFRLSATLAALILASFVFAGLGAWLTTRTSAVNEASGRLRLAHREFIRDLDASGVQHAAQIVNERMTRHDELLWRLTTPGGATLAGETSLPQTGPNAEVVELIKDGAARGDYAAITWRLPNGDSITIADDVERSERIRNAVLHSLFWVGMAAMILALIGGVWVTQRTLARMDALAATARAFGAGDLSARAPARNTRQPDDIDDLAAGFNAMLEQVNVLIADVRRVSADVAHDLRTPLSHLRQRLERARAAADAPSMQAGIDAAEESIDEIMRTFDAMLRLSAIESRDQAANRRRIDLGHILEGVTDAYRPDIEASGRTLTVALAADAFVAGDAQLIAQAISNLLLNAMRHTKPGTAITATIETLPDRVALSIADNGSGVPADLRASVLQPFKRLDDSRTQPGSGLGLAIVAAVARRHDAQLRLEDANPGLVVTLEFHRLA